MSLFEKCVEVIFRHEGGYVNHPNDPGGETNMGIAKKFFPDEDIKNLTKERATEIYHDYFWDPMNLDGINDELAILHIFDMGVNAGRQRAIKISQKIVNTQQDGIMGPITKGKINDTPDFVDQYIDSRKNYYVTLANRKPQLKVFLQGWLNRVDSTNFNT